MRAMPESRDPATYDELKWIRHRLNHLQRLRRQVDDRKALVALTELIAEAERRLEFLGRKRDSPRGC